MLQAGIVTAVVIFVLSATASIFTLAPSVPFLRILARHLGMVISALIVIALSILVLFVASSDRLGFPAQIAPPPLVTFQAQSKIRQGEDLPASLLILHFDDDVRAQSAVEERIMERQPSAIAAQLTAPGFDVTDAEQAEQGLPAEWLWTLRASPLEQGDRPLTVQIFDASPPGPRMLLGTVTAEVEITVRCGRGCQAGRFATGFLPPVAGSVLASTIMLFVACRVGKSLGQQEPRSDTA